MAWSISDLFPTWGDTGSQPADNFQYDGGDQVREDHFDYLWYAVGELEDETRSALTDIDSDADGVVDKADTGAAGFSFDGAATLGGDVTDGLGTTVWNYSAGHVPASSVEQGSGSGLDADSVDGLEPPFSSSVSDDGTQVVAVPTDINFGNNISVTDDGDDTVTVSSDDDATTYKSNDIDSNGDGVVDQSDTVSGNDGSAHYAGSLPQYADTSTAQANSAEGDLTYVQADNSVYLNDGT